MNRDFDEMLGALCAAGVEFLVVGAYALAAHGHVRATGDINIWVRSNPENGTSGAPRSPFRRSQPRARCSNELL
jgi:hypothetical protein